MIALAVGAPSSPYPLGLTQNEVVFWVVLALLFSLLWWADKWSDL